MLTRRSFLSSTAAAAVSAVAPAEVFFGGPVNHSMAGAGDPAALMALLTKRAEALADQMWGDFVRALYEDGSSPEQGGLASLLDGH